MSWIIPVVIIAIGVYGIYRLVRFGVREAQLAQYYEDKLYLTGSLSETMINHEYNRKFVLKRLEALKKNPMADEDDVAFLEQLVLTKFK